MRMNCSTALSWPATLAAICSRSFSISVGTIDSSNLFVTIVFCLLPNSPMTPLFLAVDRDNFFQLRNIHRFAWFRAPADRIGNSTSAFGLRGAFLVFDLVMLDVVPVALAAANALDHWAELGVAPRERALFQCAFESLSSDNKLYHFCRCLFARHELYLRRFFDNFFGCRLLFARLEN